MASIRRLAREPLIQFLAVGAAIFFASARLGPRADRRIVVTSGQIDRMIDTFSKTWMRPPTPRELDGLIEDHVKDEVYYREALQLGLDRDDGVIRRRLRMKMEFLNEDAAAAEEPTDAELSAYFAAHAEKFRKPPRVSFQQVFVSPSRRGPRARSEAESILGKLRKGADPSNLGDSLTLPGSMDAAGEDEIGRLFGAAFAEGVAAAPTGAWEGPIESEYGLHLIFVRDREPSVIPPLSEAREAVHREWLADRKTQVSRDQYKNLREGYEVSVEPVASTTPKSLQPR